MNLETHALTIQTPGLDRGRKRDSSRILVRELNARFEPGTVTAIVGPNGSGKTTLLRSLIGLIAPKDGQIHLAGQRLEKWSLLERARRIAYLPQRNHLMVDLMVRDLVLLGRTPHRKWYSGVTTDDKLAIHSALAAVSASHLEERGIHSLSGGELQRVMIARLLATQAGILVLDEPTSALDIGHAWAIAELCQSLARDGRTVIMAIHDLELARQFSDMALCLATGAEDEHCYGTIETVLSPDTLSGAFNLDIGLGPNGLFVEQASPTMLAGQEL